jgi:hypothetical protein
VRFKCLSELKRPELREISLATMPQSVTMAHYAREKAFKINELVRIVHKNSLEWYGFTLGSASNPDLITDIGLPRNDLNLQDYTTLGSERIAEFQESLPQDVVMNGWIHSHGALMVKHFSATDENNHRVVLDFVAGRLKRPVAKREIAIKDLVLLLENRFVEADLAEGSVCLITDAPITAATIMETVYGSFCYAIVIGDQGWHKQQIHYKENGVLSGHTALSNKEAEMMLVDTGRVLTRLDVSALRDEVEEKIQPNTNPPLEKMERM